MFRYIDDVLSLYNSKFGGFLDHIYPVEFEIKDTTDTTKKKKKSVRTAAVTYSCL
jgi:hypothetical protein